MGAAAIPVAMGIGGMLFQGEENRKNRKAAGKAGKGQEALIGRQTELFDKLSQIVSGYDQSGGFDPQKQLDQLKADTEHYAALDMGNAAGAARSLGYRPGDSEPLARIRSIDSGYKLRYGQLANQIRESAFGDKLSAYRGIDPTSLNPGIQVYGQQQAAAQGRMQNPANLFASIGPYLTQNQRQTPNYNPNNPTGWRFDLDPAP